MHALWRRGRDIAPLCSAPPFRKESKASFRFLFSLHRTRVQILFSTKRKSSMTLKAIKLFLLAEREGFEPSVSCPTTVFKTVTLNHSVTSPCRYSLRILAFDDTSNDNSFGANTKFILSGSSLLVEGLTGGCSCP